MLTIRIASHLPNIEHRAIVFKREDGGMHYMEFAGVEIDDDAQILAPAEPASTRRIEVYGDSVSCGERNEAVLCTGKADPDEDLSAYSNSWFAYDAIAARALGADLRIISQGGAPLLDGIGWFNAPDYLGMESIWIVCSTIPRSASPPTGISATTTRRWSLWRSARMIRTRTISWPQITPASRPRTGAPAMPSSWAICSNGTRMRISSARRPCCSMTANWDRAIDEVVSELDNPQITHFDYPRARNWHPGAPPHCRGRRDARELVAYIDSFGAELWQ